MSTEFNYVRAWEELAMPAFVALDAFVHQLIECVVAQSRDCHQDKSLDVAWPEGVNLRAAFDKFGDEDLARAARVVYFFGHWRPDKGELFNQTRPAEHHFKYHPGWHWKFSNYVDQVLRERLGIPRDPDDKSRVSYAVYEGLIRVQYADKHTWTWAEVAPATRAVHDKVKHRTGTVNADNIDQRAAEVIAELCPPGHWAAPWLAKRKFMDHVPGTKYANEEVVDLLQPHAGDAFKLHPSRIVNATVDNYPGRGHIYTIGPAAFKADSMYIDTEAPCAFSEPGYHKCGRPASAHHYEHALMCEATRDLSNAEAHAALLRMKRAIDAHNAANADKVQVDGFGFIGKFKILDATPEEIAAAKETHEPDGGTGDVPVATPG